MEKSGNQTISAEGSPAKQKTSILMKSSEIQIEELKSKISMKKLSAYQFHFLTKLLGLTSLNLDNESDDVLLSDNAQYEI